MNANRAAGPVERPLRLGELLAETAHVYANRLWAALGLGGFLAGMIALASIVPDLANLLVVALAFTGCYAAASRVVSGDHLREAFAQVALRLPVLLVLTVVVSVPLALALSDILVLLFGVAWLALMGFSIPVAMLERGDDGESWFRRLGYTVTRSVNLARVEYLHAVGVAAALAILYVFVGSLLASALVGFADDSGFLAFLLVQVVLAPFFFLGLAVLYFEQKARALSSPAE
jgi:hypothetical protein